MINNNKLKILVIQLRQLGDVILTTPLVRQIRRIYPDAEIHYLTENLGSQVYLYNKNIDKLIIVPNKMSLIKLAKTYAQVYKEKYEIVIDAFCNPKSAQITYFSMAKERVGFDFSNRKYAYNRIIKSSEKHEYSAVTKLRLMEYMGADLSDDLIEFPINFDLKKYALNFFQKYKLSKLKVIALNVVSRREYKVWQTQHFISVSNWLIEKGYFLLFTYGFGEYEMAKNVYDGIQNKDLTLIDYSIPSIAELRAILELCYMYIGNDGGIKHLAVCANIPTFTIFQNINWKNWTPSNLRKNCAVTNCLDDKNLCNNCFDKSMCFKNLKAETVISKLNEFICLEKPL